MRPCRLARLVENLRETPQDVGLLTSDAICCPVCQTRVVWYDKHAQCESCRREYPIVEGIPDFRLFHGEKCGYANRDVEARNIAPLAEFARKHSADDLLRHWVASFTSGDKRQSALAESYLAFRRSDAQKAALLIRHLADEVGSLHSGAEASASRDLSLGVDIGCGSGGGVRGLTAVCRTVIGIDIQLAELICARKCIEEAGLADRCLLLAANAESLPLFSHTADIVSALDVYEHVADRRRFVREGMRLLTPAGLFYFETQSRFKWIEGHVRLPGLGYLPHPLQKLYVRLCRGCEYPIFLPSLWGLRRLVRREAGNRAWRLDVAPIISPRHGRLSWRGRLIRRWPLLVRWVNWLMAPFSSYFVYIRGMPDSHPPTAHQVTPGFRAAATNDDASP